MLAGALTGIAILLGGGLAIVGTHFTGLAYIWHLFPERDLVPREVSRWGFCAYVQGALGDDNQPGSALTWTLGRALGVILFLGWSYLTYFLPFSLGIVAVLLTLPLLRIGGLYLQREDLRTISRRHLAELGFPLCVWCGYDLRGIVEPVCPECGKGPYPGTLKPRKLHDEVTASVPPG